MDTDPASILASQPAGGVLGGAWAMVAGADPVVQGVIVILLAASVVTWTILLAKGIELLAARRRVRRAVAIARHAADLDAMGVHPLARHLGEEARAEARRSAGLPADGTKDRIMLRLRRIEAGLARRAGTGTGLLASIGACAPFIGLFGTVWGIMNSFMGISRAQSTSLAVVAPGIAEALLATAIGLAAAIPAVLTYNLFARMVTAYRAELADLSAYVLAAAAREVDAACSSAGGMVLPMVPRRAAE